MNQSKIKKIKNLSKINCSNIIYSLIINMIFLQKLINKIKNKIQKLSKL